MEENKLLQMALDNEQARLYYGCVLIYPRRFMNSMVLDALLCSLKDTYDFHKIMDVIKAMPKR